MRTVGSCGHKHHHQNQDKPARLTAAAVAAAAAAASATKFEEKKREQKSLGNLFEDDEFPANASSLFPDRQGNSKYVWKRPHEICTNPEFSSDGISRFDVKQGELGDCWLLAAISSFSMHKNLFEAVVPPNQEFSDSDYCGMFRFQFWRFGEWKEVIVDDRLPTKNSRLCFMRSQDKNEFWSALLEKAYAKLFGCYAALIGGSQGEAMEDFTGGLCETFEMTKAPDNLYEIMYQASKAQSLIGCSIEDEVIEGVLDNGLITGHAYSVTDVRKCKLIGGDEETLVRVRNPWGNDTEWDGDWSDNSKLWDNVSLQEKKRLSIDVGDDGEFWMSYSDFAEQFNKLEVCHLTPDAMSAGSDPEVAKKRKWEMCLETGNWKKGISAGGCRNFIDTFHTNPQFRIEIVDPDPDDDEDFGSIIVGLMQVDMRKLTRGTDFHTIGYAIYSITDDDVGILQQRFFRTKRQADKSQFVNQREITGRHKLPPGKYLIVPSTYEPNCEANFILRIFSERQNKSDVADDNNECAHVTSQSEHTWQPKVVKNEEPLRKAFLDISANEAKIHARQLQRILNRSFSKELKKFSGFGLESCRSLLALVDSNMSGEMEFDEFKILWAEIRSLKSTFKKYDIDANGEFNSSELREALKAAGYQLCNCVFESVAMRYMDPDTSSISFEDFILLAVRLRIAFENFRGMDKEADGKAVVTEKHYLMQTIYL